MSTLFDPEIHEELNDPGAVVFHECAHAAVWYFHGGGIGRLRLLEGSDGLGGAVLTRPYPAFDETQPRFVDAAVERLLAGEIAARRYVGLPAAISAGRYCARWSPVVPSSTARRHVEATCRGDEDIVRIVQVADIHHSDDWWPWLEERYRNVRGLVDVHFSKIRTLADVVNETLSSAPRPYDVAIPGFRVLSTLRDARMPVHPAAGDPVELLLSYEREPVRVRLSRVARACIGKGWRTHRFTKRAAEE